MNSSAQLETNLTAKPRSVLVTLKSNVEPAPMVALALCEGKGESGERSFCKFARTRSVTRPLIMTRSCRS